MSKFLHILLFFALIAPSASPAFETDQFNLPEEPLADIGAEVSQYVRDNLEKAAAKINGEIAERQNCLDVPAAKRCESAAKNQARLKYLRSNEAVAREVFNLLGSGFPPFTASGSWMEAHQFAARPARYKTDYKQSIYATFPSNYFTISETVKVFGAQFGTDKIAHFFQQGYTYLRIYERGRAKNLPEEAATEKACAWGRNSERTFYGNLVSGVYSNADLAANFAGMKFYQNLTGEIKIGERAKPPIFVLDGGIWKFNSPIDPAADWFAPFVSDHFNEAWNSSIYTKVFGLRKSVRGHVKKRACAEWKRAFPTFSKTDFEETSLKLQKWFGADYGFTSNKSFITIANTCF